MLKSWKFWITMIIIAMILIGIIHFFGSDIWAYFLRFKYDTSVNNL